MTEEVVWWKKFALDKKRERERKNERKRREREEEKKKKKKRKKVQDLSFIQKFPFENFLNGFSPHLFLSSFFFFSFPSHPLFLFSLTFRFHWAKVYFEIFFQFWNIAFHFKYTFRLLLKNPIFQYISPLLVLLD